MVLTLQHSSLTPVKVLTRVRWECNTTAMRLARQRANAQRCKAVSLPPAISSPCCSPLAGRQRVAEQQARQQHRQELPRRHDGRKQQRAVAPDGVRDEQLTCAGQP